MVAETKLSVDDLIWPIFIGDGENKREPVIAMPCLLYTSDAADD